MAILARLPRHHRSRLKRTVHRNHRGETVEANRVIEDMGEEASAKLRQMWWNRAIPPECDPPAVDTLTKKT